MELGRLSDEELLVLARTSPRAFAIFYERHVEAVFAYVRRRCGGGDVAFDLTAETFAQALRAVPRYQPRPEPARAWLFAIARNTLSAAVRAGRVQDRARRALAMEPLVLADDEVEALERADAGSPALDAVGDLPDDQRAAVLARHVEGASYAEIAVRLRCSESVVRQRVSRGLRTVRLRLQEGER